MLIIRLLCVVIFASLTIYTAPVLMAEPNLFPAFFVALVENVHPAGDLFKTPARRGDHQQRVNAFQGNDLIGRGIAFHRFKNIVQIGLNFGGLAIV